MESCLQKVVSLSPTEAEYVAATKAIQEALWLKGFMKEISRIRNPINCDNQSALFLMENPMFHESSKHMNVKLHFIRDNIAVAQARTVKVASWEKAAAALTKPLASIKFKHCLDFVQVEDLRRLELNHDLVLAAYPIRIWWTKDKE